jgi:chromosome segregation ATPase
MEFLTVVPEVDYTALQAGEPARSRQIEQLRAAIEAAHAELAAHRNGLMQEEESLNAKRDAHEQTCRDLAAGKKTALANTAGDLSLSEARRAGLLSLIAHRERDIGAFTTDLEPLLRDESRLQLYRQADKQWARFQEMAAQLDATVNALLGEIDKFIPAFTEMRHPDTHFFREPTKVMARTRAFHAWKKLDEKGLGPLLGTASRF